MKANKTFLLTATTLSLSMFCASSFAKTPYNISFSELYKSGVITNSTNIKRARWIATTLNLDKVSFKLNIKNYFQNDRKTSGFTGCASVKVFSKNGDVLYEHVHQRGVNSKIRSNHRATKYGVIDLSAFKDAPAALATVSIKQWHCRKGFKIRAGNLAKQGLKIVGNTMAFGKAIQLALGK